MRGFLLGLVVSTTFFSSGHADTIYLHNGMQRSANFVAPTEMHTDFAVHHLPNEHPPVMSCGGCLVGPTMHAGPPLSDPPPAPKAPTTNHQKGSAQSISGKQNHGR